MRRSAGDLRAGRGLDGGWSQGRCGSSSRDDRTYRVIESGSNRMRDAEESRERSGSPSTGMSRMSWVEAEERHPVRKNGVSRISDDEQ